MGNPITVEEFNSRIYKLVGDEYSFLEDYKGRHTKLLCRHNSCGYTWKVEAGAFLGNKNKKGSRCPVCAGNIVKTTEQYSKEVSESTNGEYTLISNYVNAHTHVIIRHNVCGKYHRIVPNSFQQGIRCPFCDGGIPYTQETACEKIDRDSKGAYELYGKYNGCFNEVTLRHKVCGTLVTTTFALIATHKSLPMCPVCYPKSYGEGVIGDYLHTKNIVFVPQKHFSKLEYKGSLSYDFWLPSLKTLIEYQGIQHYEPVEFFGGDKKFKEQQDRDNLKREYAESHGYNLICIKYTNKDRDSIYNILDKSLK